jgi:hypothetical protein
VAVAVGQSQQCFLKTPDMLLDLLGGVTKVESEIEGDLIIPASGRVKLGSSRADPASELGLDVHVNVFKVAAEFKLARFDVLLNPKKTVFDRTEFGLGQDSCAHQGAGMRDTAPNVVSEKLPVGADRFSIAFEQVGLLLFKTAFPHSFFLFEGYSCGKPSARRLIAKGDSSAVGL